MGSDSAAFKMNWVMAAIAGTLSAIIGAMGLGGGGVLLIYLNLFTQTPQTLAQGINLLFFVPSAIVAIIIYIKKKLVNFKLAIIFSLLGLVGALAGSYLACFIESRVLSKLFAILLLIMGALQFRKKG